MGNIPLDFQRRCEQRWAARFARQAPEPSPLTGASMKSRVNGPARPTKLTGRPAGPTRRVEICPSSVSTGHRVSLTLFIFR